MKALLTLSFLLAVYAVHVSLTTSVHARSLQQTGCSSSPGPRPDECSWEWRRDEIDCRGLANGTRLECEAEDDGRYIECEFEQPGMRDIKFTCNVDVNCQTGCQESDLASIPAEFQGQVESILTAWVPYDD